MNVINKIKLFLEIKKNMGWEYVWFRGIFMIKQKTGFLKKGFPTKPSQHSFLSLSEWKSLPAKFFFKGKMDIKLNKRKSDDLHKEYLDFMNGKIAYFNADVLDVGCDYDWLTNPSNGYRYDISKHWTDVADISSEAGDIKYVWEKSRFSYIYSVIRHDYHFDEDHSEIVFREIEDWISANPINQGPNYKCSQEISLRVLNWTFSLYFYMDSDAFTEERFQKIMHAIYWQIKHVRANINFSRKSVRNNHAITETLMLYLGGLLFPFFPEANEWKTVGKKWFEEEIKYQIYSDGTFLQYSMNYHRVVIQLLTWALVLADKNNEKFDPIISTKAYKSLDFLYQCMDDKSGFLPNYGANDGALFFKLNQATYRDYRPSLNALHFVLKGKPLFADPLLSEDIFWYNTSTLERDIFDDLKKKNTCSFEDSGYFLFRDSDSFTFIRCGSHQDRPTHADNLHLDIWVKGRNIFRDAGSFKYNTTEELKKYFGGTSAHNTVSLGGFDQMKRGSRFIWLNWTRGKIKRLDVSRNDYWEFDGEVNAFEYLQKGILHKRKVNKHVSKLEWNVVDKMEHNTGLPMLQWWNFPINEKDNVKITAIDDENQIIKPVEIEGYYSDKYGVKETSVALCFETNGKMITTTIEVL